MYGSPMPLHVLELADLTDPPKVKIDLPLVRVGDRLRLGFTLKRRNGGRHEHLKVSGYFRVVECVFDSSRPVPCSIAKIEAVGKAPVWQAVKAPRARRKPVPAQGARTTVS